MVGFWGAVKASCQRAFLRQLLPRDREFPGTTAGCGCNLIEGGPMWALPVLSLDVIPLASQERRVSLSTR